MKNIFKIVFIFIFFEGLIYANSILPKKYQTLSVVSAGKGELYIRWFVPPRYWSENGWILSCDNKRKIIPLDRKMVYFLKLLKNKKLTKKENRNFNFLLLQSFMDFNKAKKHGFGAILKVSKKGKISCKIQAIGKKEVELKSKKIDAFKTTPLPSPPKILKAKNKKGSIELYWKHPKKAKFPPFAYKVYRKMANKSWKLLTNPYILSGLKWDEKKPLFSDNFAPLEKRVTYKVVGIDIFQRVSKPSYVTIFHPDLKALTPPENLTAKAVKNSIKLQWNKSDNPFTYGYIIERGTWLEGFFTLLTPKPLKRDTQSFTDKTAKKEIEYLYRIKSVNTRGKQGAPSKLVKAILKESSSPSSIKKIDAKISPQQVKILWKNRDKKSIGVIVEKRYKGSKGWVELNDRPIIENEYDDLIPHNSTGVVYYRIVNVGKNGKKSKPSNEIKVKLPGHLPLYAPDLKKLYSKDAKAILEFSASDIGEKPDKIFIYRGLINDAKGKIIAKLNPKQIIYIDEKTIPGKRYWYALLSVKKNGYKGKMSRKFILQIAYPPIPTPKKPTLKYIKKPFRYVKISFKKAPSDFGVTIFSKKDGESFWTMIASNIKGNYFIESNLPKSGIVNYKIAYNTPTLHEGNVSKISKIFIK